MKAEILGFRRFKDKYCRLSITLATIAAHLRKFYTYEQILDIAYIRNIQKMLILLKQKFFLLTWTTIENISRAKFKYIRRDEKDISFKVRF